jgi:hypothetical protein
MMILGTTRKGDLRKQLTAQNGIALIAPKKPPITKRIASQKILSKVTPRMRHNRIKAMPTSIPPTKPCNIYLPRRVSSGLQDAVWVVISTFPKSTKEKEYESSQRAACETLCKKTADSGLNFHLRLST